MGGVVCALVTHLGHFFRIDVHIFESLAILLLDLCQVLGGIARPALNDLIIKLVCTALFVLGHQCRNTATIHTFAKCKAFGCIFQQTVGSTLFLV